MKNRITGWITVTAILMMIAAGCHKAPEGEPIPEDAAVYFRMDRLQESWTVLSEREFMQRSAEWKIWNEPWMKEALKPLASLRSDFERDTGVPLNEETIMLLFGKRVELAVLPGNPLPSVLLISELGKSSTALKVISRTMETLEKDRISTYDFNDMTITAVKADDSAGSETATIREVVYCIEDDRLFAATDRGSLERFITLRDTPERSLCASPDFRNVIATLNQPANLVFVSSDRVLNMAASVGTAFGMETGLSNPKANIWAAGMTVTDAGILLNTALKPPREDIEQWSAVYRHPDALKRAGKWLSSDCIAGSVAGIDIPGLMEQQKSILSTIDDPEGMDLWTRLTAVLQELTDLDVPAELQRWGGKGMFFTMQNIRMITVVPIPDLAFGIHVRDREAAATFITALRNQIETSAGPEYGSFSRETLTDDYVYHYLPIPLLPGFQPGYAMCDDYMLFGTSAATVEQSIRSFTGKSPDLLHQPAMASLVSMGDTDVIAYQTFDPPKFSAVAKTALDSVSLFLVAANQKPEMYREVLDTLNTVPLIAFRLTLQDDMLVYNGMVEMR